MYLVRVVRTASQQDVDSEKTRELILKWIEVIISVLNDFFVVFFKDYAYAIQWVPRGLINTKDFLVNHVLLPLDAILQKNPRFALFISLAIFIGPWIILIPLILIMTPLLLIQEVLVLILTILGFTVSGITGSTPAALFHSFCYDAGTPAGSMFAYLQTVGAAYQVNTTTNPVLLVVKVVAGVVAVYIIVWMIP
ncbi:uncharacterized protein BT62DRAFT_932734 [Guyanagaster necrorhizus]|uniref:Uncharacterized protein n=1 Tax=Guyanagaster necrorhizus TaxID=856835 RepID=A0A9P7VRP4_9AGAR|nr:uncharacterized protein BT62DRAFT_932734 [Guyanagaster necrorhizus MCA 3950]KAG7445592.1 hypothetical protein BT62DRAFT_932734 [Guyanagaster necrorhizus MCA 3950]